MQKLIVILFLCLYCAGGILSPFGNNMSLTDMYRHCEAEDPDMDVADFVIEHLLNFSDVFEHFDKDDNDKNERPHQPFQHIAPSSFVVVLVSKPVKFECKPVFYERKEVDYSIFNGLYLPAAHLAAVFRPPIV